MHSRTRRGPDVDQNTMHRRPGRVLAAVLVVAPMALAGCSGTTSPFDRDPTVVNTTTLVGTWSGSLDGGSAANSYGTARITTILRGDSTFTMEADNPLYCSLNNTQWSIALPQFTATGRDCTGTIITLMAPVAARRLTGTWTASSGRGGTFTIDKQ